MGSVLYVTEITTERRVGVLPSQSAHGGVVVLSRTTGAETYTGTASLNCPGAVAQAVNVEAPGSVFNSPKAA